MGMFVVNVQAVGGHGCQRDIKDSQVVAGCGQPTCPDCIARRFVAELKNSGASVETATLTHWPGQPGVVVDDLVSGVRAGSF
jgi:hypothetical protein